MGIKHSENPNRRFLRLRSAVATVAMMLLFGLAFYLIGCESSGSIGVSLLDPPGDQPAFPFIEGHVDQFDITDGTIGFQELFLLGDELFEVDFNGLDGIGILELPDGTLLLGVALGSSDVGYMWRSTDGGRTWDRSRRIHIQGWYDNADGFFSNSRTYATGSGKLLHFLRVGEPSPMTPMRRSSGGVCAISRHWCRRCCAAYSSIRRW